MGRLLRTLVGAVLAASGLSVVGIASGHGLNALSGGCAAADGMHHVALVVEHLDSSSHTYCDSFSGASVSGEQVLRDSGLEYSLQNYGGNGDAVCEVDHEPAGYTSCFQDGRFWALFRAPNAAQGGWSYSSQGISMALHDGEAVGLRYQSQSSSAPPGSPSGVCPVSTPPPAPAPPPPSPRATPSPQRSSTPTAPAGAGASAPPAGNPGAAPPTPPPAAILPPGPALASGSPFAVAVAPATAGTRPPVGPPATTGIGVLAPLLSGAAAVALLALLLFRGARSRQR